jgi:hypothetical protein
LDPPPATSLTLQFRPEGNATRVVLLDGERPVSWLWVIPFHLRIGCAVVRMDGIGGVGTEEDCRRRGYSRRVLEETVRWMRSGDGALSMLYGIPDYYPRFGYATAGPEHLATLPAATHALPRGWHCRAGSLADMPALRRLYDDSLAEAVGAALRPPGGPTWTGLVGRLQEWADAGDELRVVQDPRGEVAAYLWRDSQHWYPRALASDHPGAFVLGEVVVRDRHAAEAALPAAASWAAEPQPGAAPPAAELLLALPPAGALASAAMLRGATFRQAYSACGGSMARVLDTARLLRSLQPELTRRWLAAGAPLAGSLALHSETGSATLHYGPRGVSVERGAAGAARACVVPQAILARLALGAMDPEFLLSRTDAPSLPREGQVPRVLTLLFPPRFPHMHLPDRY